MPDHKTWVQIATRICAREIEGRWTVGQAQNVVREPGAVAHGIPVDRGTGGWCAVHNHHSTFHGRNVASEVDCLMESSPHHHVQQIKVPGTTLIQGPHVLRQRKARERRRMGVRCECKPYATDSLHVTTRTQTVDVGQHTLTVMTGWYSPSNKAPKLSTIQEEFHSCSTLNSSP